MKKRLCSVVLTAAMVIGLVSPAYGAALPETSVPETTQETVSSGDSAGAGQWGSTSGGSRRGD